MLNIGQLEAICGSAGVVADAASLEAYRIDGIKPQAAVLPSSLKEAAEVVRLANAEKFPLAILGGGSLAGMGGALRGAEVVLCTRRLDKVIDMDVENLTVTAQAGVRFGDLQDLLSGLENRCFFPQGDLEKQAEYMCSGRDYKGSYLPLDPPLASAATLGGTVAGGVTGPMRLRHGLPRDVLLGVRFISPTGEIIGMGGKVVKNVSGYDVSKLMIGSLGCLGVLGEMTLRLLPLPEVSGALLIGFASLDQAVAFARAVVASKLLPSALEVCNLAAAKAGREDAPAGSWFAAVGQAGFAEDVARERSDLLALARDQGGSAQVLDGEAAARFWAAFGAAPLKQSALRLKAVFRLGGFGEFLAAAQELDGGAMVTCSAGCGAALVHLPAGAPAALAGTTARLRAKAVELGGALTVQAGSPELKAAVDAWGPARADWGLMMEIKRQLDPNRVLNPGRFVGGL